MKNNIQDFNLLVENISDIHIHLQGQAVNTINRALSIRNWLIGAYIVEYEQNGKDRAEYGKKLLLNIANKFKHIKGLDERALSNFRRVYLLYPQVKDYLYQDGILGSAPPILGKLEIRGSAPPISDNNSQIDTPASNIERKVSGEHIITKLSYTHLERLIRISDDLKRTFYEIETIKGTWSVRELKRQIGSLYYERTGLSKNPEKLTTITQQKTQPRNSTDIIKNIYAFDFIDIKNKTIIEESDLESALLNNINDFILELGNGFCFEARQKRILIGDNYYYIDLVFYHRILKCHVIVELKLGAFSHGDIGQLNTYLNFFKEEICEIGDRPPVGILMVAEKNNSLVKFATAGMDENLFVQQYLINLPNKELLEQYIDNELRCL